MRMLSNKRTGGNKVQLDAFDNNEFKECNVSSCFITHMLGLRVF